jgi:hypothetical protein
MRSLVKFINYSTKSVAKFILQFHLLIPPQTISVSVLGILAHLRHCYAVEGSSNERRLKILQAIANVQCDQPDIGSAR